MRKLLPSIFATVLLAGFAFNYAGSANDRIISVKEKNMLRSSDPMTFVYMKGKGNAVSNVPDPADFLNISALPAGWDRYDVVIVEKAYLKVKVNDVSRLKIFNAITGRSGLKGMRYYSISESGIRRLILESYRVRSCSDRTYIADETVKALPAKSESAFMIRDNRLGMICFNGTAEYRDGMFIETDVSCGRVSRLGMRVFNDGGYVIRHYLLPDDSGTGFFYCSVQIMKVESSIMKKLDLLNSQNFGNRIRGETVHLFGLAGYDISSKLAVFR